MAGIGQEPRGTGKSRLWPAVIEGPPDWPLGAVGTTVSYTALLFLASDGSRFLLHKVMHEVPLLWRFHQVHHSAQSER